MAGRGGNGDTLPQRDPNTFISNVDASWNAGEVADESRGYFAEVLRRVSVARRP